MLRRRQFYQLKIMLKKQRLKIPYWLSLNQKQKLLRSKQSLKTPRFRRENRRKTVGSHGDNNTFSLK